MNLGQLIARNHAFVAKLYRNSVSKKSFCRTNLTRRLKALSVTCPIRDNHTKSSSLYYPEEDYTVDVPVDIDLNLEKILASPASLKENLAERNITLDVDKLIQDFKLMCDLEKKKCDFESERKDIGKRVTELINLMKKSGENDNLVKSVDVLKSRGNKLKKLEKELSDRYFAIKHAVMLDGLKIPNRIHPETPTSAQILRSFGNIMDFSKSRSHIEIGREKDLIKFSDIGPKSFYLKGDLALCELELIDKTKKFLQQNGMTTFLLPDKVRSIIMEGCGFDVDSDKILTIHDPDPRESKVIDEHHLQGNSVQSFVAFLMRQMVDNSQLPLKYFSVGSRYVSGTELPGLFGGHQYANAVIFGASLSETESSNLFQEYSELIWSFLESFNLPIRQILVPVQDLSLSESLRSEFQMWSPSLEDFVNMGYLCMCDDFVSRRLMCLHDSKKEGSMFVHMIGGEVINITNLLALMLEYDLPLISNK
ncbi:hypothetical protein LOTGIDRAFT_170435 [Lottia gigantea]|uniref:Aminoacyl-tRNA synthetase class II (G/ P/ S/T) domain-containing protein n=1 Tax=Lottia gigantea TaxID=225164 RepID=V3ZI83_LOTGI|nr:hypothetical protein LOTGIDRAFT_170435 [Lottia gigantea]ESO82025.1 hypothetical protein LOTGIDRAFT_170435 [Lottia gigantea]